MNSGPILCRFDYFLILYVHLIRSFRKISEGTKKPTSVDRRWVCVGARSMVRSTRGTPPLTLADHDEKRVFCACPALFRAVGAVIPIVHRFDFRQFAKWVLRWLRVVDRPVQPARTLGSGLDVSRDVCHGDRSTQTKSRRHRPWVSILYGSFDESISNTPMSIDRSIGRRAAVSGTGSCQETPGCHGPLPSIPSRKTFRPLAAPFPSGFPIQAPLTVGRTVTAGLAVPPRRRPSKGDEAWISP